jgi:hypothetical protein
MGMSNLSVRLSHLGNYSTWILKGEEQLLEHRHNLQQDLLEKSKPASHAYEEGHRIGWDDARILDIESNSRYRKYKESAHMACVTNPISQPSVGISPIWIPLISNEVSTSQRKYI